MKNIDNRISKRILLVITLFLLVLAISLIPLKKKAYALDEETVQTYNIESADQLATYANAYARGGRNPNDTLKLTLLSSYSNWVIPSSFEGIGTSDRPFNGTVIIGTGASDVFYLERALFKAITTNVKIVNDANQNRSITLNRTSSNNSPIFAEEVKKAKTGTNNANWSVVIGIDNRDNENLAVCDTGGLIGSIESEAIVTVSLTNNAYNSSISTSKKNSNIIGNDVLGSIAGTVGGGARLTVASLGGTNTLCKVVSTGGHTGGVVGVMEDGASLVLPSNFTSLYDVETSTGYAGSIVGHGTNATISTSDNSILTLTKTTNGKSGSGGLYGYYSNTTANRIIDLEKVASDSNFIITATGNSANTGGIIGELKSTTSMTIKDSGISDVSANDTYARAVKLQGGRFRGGVIGEYDNSSLSNTLTINNIKVEITENSGSKTYTGGIIGKFKDTFSGVSLTVRPVYVLINGINVNATASVQGGAIGSMGLSGSFVDFTGYARIKGSFSAGLVDYMNKGVIRLAGTTDLSSATLTSAQLVTHRMNGLIYANGSGVGNGWILKRGSGRVDDVYSWGEVLRLSNDYNGLQESDFFTISNHMVTVAAHVSEMATIKDFIKTALNIQLNEGDIGALNFTETSASNKSVSDTILESNLSISADINLEKTGIVGFMRDELYHDNRVVTTSGLPKESYNRKEQTAATPYSGTFNGNGHKITLAIGEPYGKDSSGNNKTSSDVGDNNYGTIYSHSTIGLFAVVKDATITSLEVDGYISTACESNEHYVGGLVGFVKGTTIPLTLTSVTTSQTNYIYSRGASVYSGGAVGCIGSGATGTVAITSSNFNAIINEKRTSEVETDLGGVIGYVETTDNLVVNFSTINLGGTYNNTVVGSSSFNNVNYGGLIGVINSNNGAATRTVNINSVTIKNSFAITSKITSGTERTAGSGALIGSKWFDTEVTIGAANKTGGITIGENTTGTPAIAIPSESTNVNVGVLFYKATGYMRVNHVNVVKLSVSSAVNANSFGFVVNDAIDEEKGLYLELISDGFTISAASITGNYTIYDEACAYSKDPNKDIDENGHAVISIELANGDAITMDGTNCNTYQNKNTKGNGKVNSYTRYYYNINLMRANNNKSNPEKLVLWSLTKYATSNLTSYFAGGFTTTISGNDLDMEGYSYYPVDASGMTIASGTSIKFYNQEIESGESGTGNTDSTVRSTRGVAATSQHYLMHEGLFRNYSGALTVNGLTVSGNISNSHGGSGFLVCKMLGNLASTSNINLNNIVLNNAKVNGSNLKPLLINEIGMNTNFTLTSISTTGYDNPTTAVASSLIGHVGSDDAKNISLIFSDIRLDARTSALASLDGKYGTTRSIFESATLLYSFRYINGGFASYNFTYDEDWTSSQHHVTYGQEIKTTTEYAGKQNKYYGDSTHFVDPSSNSNTTSEYNFSTGFLPYVLNSITSDYKHEIRINIADSAKIEGCGKYNDPYRISGDTAEKAGDKLNAIYLIIYGTPAGTTEITLPDTLNNWCSDSSTDRIYKYVSGSFTAQDGSGKTKTLAEVREYLAGAYYSIDRDVTITADHAFAGLGNLNSWTATDFLCPYAFRGVIVGNNKTIRIEKAVPLVKSANGCVVKDLTVEVNGTLTVSQTATATLNYSNTTLTTYGAVIGQVMAGDNILDNVGVDLTDLTIDLGSTTFCRLVPIGGFIGAVLTGGVIFRNVASVSSSHKTGITVEKCDKITPSTTDNWLYVNPIIGRVIAGYAFSEVNGSYFYDEDTTQLKNGTKNYSIPTLDSSDTTCLNVTATSASAHKITVYDGQGLYLLSCIVNSGAGSADYNASGTSDYTDQLANKPWIAYQRYASSRCGTYNDVGTGASSTGDYAIVNSMDVYSTFTKVPYIIYHYTNKEGSSYHTRSICNGSSPSVSEVDFVNTTFYVPAGYRGIGLIYDSNNYTQLFFNKIDGKGAIIDLRMSYQEYDGTANGENYKAYSTVESNKIFEFGVNGFGLFNALYHINASSTNVIKDFTITGNVFYDVYACENGKQNVYTIVVENNTTTNGYKYLNVQTPPENRRVDSQYVLETGGLAGVICNATYITNVSLGISDSGLVVEGAKYAGGMIGYSRGKAITIVSPGANNLSVIAGIGAGGLVGSIIYGANISISSPNPINLNITEVNGKGSPTPAKFADTKNKFSYDYVTAGGLIGRAWLNTSSTITINNININRGTIHADAIIRDTSDTEGTPNSKDYQALDNLRFKTSVGGLIGYLNTAKLAISNCEIKKVAFYGCWSGGIIGHGFANISGTISDVSVLGKTDESDTNEYTIEGRNIASGFCGVFYLSGSVNLAISSLRLEGYNIISTGTGAERPGAGGVFGIIYYPDWKTNSKFNLSDSIIRNCVITRTQNPKNANLEFLGVGGIIGSLTAASSVTAGKFTGYNILLDGVTVNGDNSNFKPGIIVGTNHTSSSVHNSSIRLVGIKINDCELTKNGSSVALAAVGRYTTDPYGTDGYVVFADCNGASLDEDNANTANSYLYQAVDNNSSNNPDDYAAVSPYVTVNPGVNIADGALLTGDGMAATALGLPIYNILAANGAGLYSYSSSYISTFNRYIGKLSTFNTEQSTSLANDFAVLAVDDMVKVNTTEMINAYINLLANTNYNYGIDVANVYDVKVYRMVYDENTNKFENVTTAQNPACLRRDNEQFYMTSGDADTSGTMFSLIDVRFFDPKDNTKVAYHLYVPVLVRKMVKFDFKIATGTGTNYESNWYTENKRWGENIMENLGTPTTILFEYDYLRDNDEWETAINNGENVYRNYEKRLTLEKPAALSDLPDNTILVLVDPQNNGKPYYGVKSEVVQNGYIYLNRFKTTITKNGNSYTLSGDSFSPVMFNDMLDLSISGSGNLVTTTENDEDATVKVGNTFYKFDAATTSGSKVVVNDTFDYLSEKYYISFFTDSSNSNVLYHYTISAPLNFNDPVNPSRMNNQGANISGVHVILGNIFVQSSENVKITAKTQNEEVTLANNVISAEMETTITIADGVKSQVELFLSTGSLNVYQSFLLYLNRRDASSTQRLITGNPDASGGYYITSSNGEVAASGSSSSLNSYLNASYGSINSNNNYSEFVCNQPLNKYLINGNGAVIKALVSLTYESEESISEQFPNRVRIEERSLGVTLSMSSNVAYDPTLTSTSKCSNTANDTNKVYYSTITGDSAKLYFNAISTELEGDYGSLGINPHDSKGATRLGISTEAVLDISSIIADTMNNDQTYKYDVIRISIRLRAKDSDGTYENPDLVLSQYFSDVSISGISTATGYTDSKGANSTTYTFYISRSDAVKDVETSLVIPISFMVITGSEFEGKTDHYYSNYRIIVACDLVTKEDDLITDLPKSIADDYIVYTNAKILPDFAE